MPAISYKRFMATTVARVAAALIAIVAVLPATAGAVGPRAAERIAVEALDTAAADAPRPLVFRAPRLVPAGAAVHVARLRGGRRPDATGTTSGRMAVALRAPRDERAWLLYEDRAPNTLFEHDGRVVLVGKRSGRARVSAVIQGPPVVGGRLPRFLTSFAGYRAPYYRRPRRTAALAQTTQSPLTSLATRKRAAAEIAAGGACMVRAADTLGNFHDYAAVDRSRAAVGRVVRGLRELAPNIVGRRYRRVAGTTLTDYIRRLIATHGCREVSLYLAGSGYRAGGETAIAIGVQPHPGGRIQRQLVSASDLRALLRSRPDVWWNLTFDAPHAGALLDALRGEPNLASAQTSGRAGDAAFTVRRPGARRGGMLRFSRGLLDGLRSTLADERAIAAAIADRDSKRAPTVLAALLTRSFERGIDPGSFAALGVRPQSFTRAGAGPLPGPPGPMPIDGGGPALPTPPVPQPPVPQPPAATARSLTTDEDTALEVPLARDAAQAAVATFEIVTEPEHGTLTGTGATLVYTPDADYNGPDALTFRVSEGGLTSAPGTVSITVTPVNDAPELTPGTVQLNYTANDPATAIAPGLTVADIDSTEFAGARVGIHGGYTAGQDLLEFSDQNGIAGSWNASTGTLTLTGSAARADYAAALRSVAYRNSSVAPATGLREVSFVAIDDGGGESAVRTVDVNVTD